MDQQLEIINVRLPLQDEHKLFTLQIQDGRWKNVIPQADVIQSSEHIPLASEDIIGMRSLDAQKRMIVPGMVDAHMHLDKAFSLATVGNVSGTLEEACRNYIDHVGSFSHEEVKHRVLRTALQAIAFGTSVIRTHIDFHSQLGRAVAMQGFEAALEVKQMLAPFIHIQIILLVPHIGDSEALPLIEEALSMGADGLGGAPFLSSQPKEDIEALFALSKKYGCLLDFHSDESDDPTAKTVLDVVDQTIAYGMQGQVTVGHLCSLASMPLPEAESIIARMAEAKLRAISLPGANLYLQGRGDDERVRRGVTRIKSLIKAGIPVAVASDNIHDPFHPFGRGDLVQIALLTAYSAHMGAPKDLRTLLRMITEVPAEVVGLNSYGIAAGLPADFVVFDARSPEELFMLLPDRRWVYRSSTWLRAGGHLFDWKEPVLADAWDIVSDGLI